MIQNKAHCEEMGQYSPGQTHSLDQCLPPVQAFECDTYWISAYLH